VTGVVRLASTVDLSTAGAPARRPGVEPASTPQRRPASTTQVDAVDAYHTWLASTTSSCVNHASNASNRLRQNGVNSDVKQRQIGVKGVKSGL
jgi:hypothetical protein